MTLGYVVSSKINIYKMEDVERSWFRVNPSYSRDLREAIRPSRQRRPAERPRRRSRLRLPQRMRMPAGLTILLRLWPWPAAILSGFLYAAAFPPFNQAWLCWICLTPLISAVWFSPKARSGRWLRNAPGICGRPRLFLGCVLLARVARNVFLHFPMALTALSVAACFLNSHFILPSGGVVRRADPARRNCSVRSLAKPALRVAFWRAAAWTAQEWVRAWLFGGFGWNGLGVALHSIWLLIQIAEIHRGPRPVVYYRLRQRHRGSRPVALVPGSARATKCEPHYDHDPHHAR